MITNNQRASNGWQRFRFQNWPIALKLVVVNMLHALIPLIVVTLITTQISTQALTTQMEGNLSGLSRVEAKSTNQSYEGYYLDNIVAIAESPGLRTYITKDDPDADLSALGQEVNDTIKSWMTDGSIEEIVIYDVKGNILFASDDTLIGQNVLEQTGVKTVVSGKNLVSDAYFTPIAINPTVDLSAPIYKDAKDEQSPSPSAGTLSTPEAPRGEVIGGISFRITLSYFDFLLGDALNIQSSGSSQEQQESTSVYAVNKDSVVISSAHLNLPYLYKGLGTLDETITQKYITGAATGSACNDGSDDCDEDVRTPRKFDMFPALQPLADAVKIVFETGQSQSLRYCRPVDMKTISKNPNECKGDWYVSALAPYMAAGNDKPLFVIVSDMPERIILQSVDQQRRQNVLIAILLAPIAMISSLLIARTIGRRVNKLAYIAQGVEQGTPFQEQDVAKLSEATDEIGNLARVFGAMVKALRARTDELTTIYEIGQEISSTVELGDTLKYILRAIRQAIPYDWAELRLMDDSGKKLVLEVAADFDSIEEAHSDPYDAEQGYIGQLIKQGNGLLVTDTTSYPTSDLTTARTWQHVEPKSYLGVPLRNKDKIIGTIEMVTSTLNGFDKGKLRVLESIAAQASVAVQNAQEVRAREERLKQQIVALRIEVDEAKKTRELDTITSSEYFQDLKSKLNDLRKRNKGKGDTGEDAEPDTDKLPE